MKYGEISKTISNTRFLDEEAVIADLLKNLQLDEARSQAIFEQTKLTVEALRNDSSLDLLEEFLAEYGLSTDEGIALMCLAEAYLRTPDESSLDALIRDKIGSGHWEQHLGTARSLLINASSWGLMLTGKILGDEEPSHEEIRGTLKKLLRRLSEPAIRKAVEQVMKILGRQFVLGSTIQKAMKRAVDKEKRGYRHSYDMLGEAALTDKDARAYLLAYSKAISAISEKANLGSALDNPGISVKLSALHPRYETVQFERVMQELVPRVSSLAQMAHSANIGFTIDAEESERLEISLNVIRKVLQNPTLQGWDGFGIVVQTYFKQAPAVIDFLYSLANKLDRKITIRLVKGAYWDFEIKNAQVQGLQNYPVFTRKQSTDLCYLVCAEKLMGMTDRIFPQFATHNAHTVHSILEIAGDNRHFEFQRLHGMGEALYERLREQTGKGSRIYAPVGVHKDLLAYLVRRLLENGANSSFIHQLHDDNVPSAVIAADPVEHVRKQQLPANPAIPLPPDMFGDKRRNSEGLSLNLPAWNHRLDEQMQAFRDKHWSAEPGSVIAGKGLREITVRSPIDGSVVGTVKQCSATHVREAIHVSTKAFRDWSKIPVDERALILERIADLYEQNIPELIALATREAGKTRLDGILEVREAVDFCRFYAVEARDKLAGFDARGPFVCISPWNFPLAIFTGQIVAALVAGNSVLAKPAESTALTAALAVRLMHQAGVPEEALILLPGEGSVVGAALTSDSRIGGVCFTGSTETATRIDRSLSEHTPPNTPLIAETGGINAMIVDSTALPEQAVKHIVSSAFQSAGQRCSALRLLLVQEESAPNVLEMLEGASMELAINDPWQARVDVGPIIDRAALKNISEHCDRLEKKGQLLFRVPLPANIPDGSFIGPSAYQLDRFEDLDREIFGPVLHVVTYRADQLDEMVDKINASGYGLTLGVQSRIDDRIESVCERARVGNIYVNRNQIGAVVGVQPFGGEGKSGTGPKAGGPFYLYRFCRDGGKIQRLPADRRQIFKDQRQSWENSDFRFKSLNKFATELGQPLAEIAGKCLQDFGEFSDSPVVLDGPTGEMNTIGLHPRGKLLCLGGAQGDQQIFTRQVVLSLLAGNPVVLPDSDFATLAKKSLKAAGLSKSLLEIIKGDVDALMDTPDLHGIVCDADTETLGKIRKHLAARDGARVPLLSANDDIYRFTSERVISIDTTAAGGNATLLAS